MIKGWKNNPQWRAHFDEVRRKRVQRQLNALRLGWLQMENDHAMARVGISPGSIVVEEPRKRWWQRTCKDAESV